MKIHDILESQTLEEGPNDPHIFKAVFLAGGPGSGKSFVANKMLGGTGLKAIDSDMIYEYMADKQGLDLSDPEQVAVMLGKKCVTTQNILPLNEETYIWMDDLVLLLMALAKTLIV